MILSGDATVCVQAGSYAALSQVKRIRIASHDFFRLLDGVPIRPALTAKLLKKSVAVTCACKGKLSGLFEPVTATSFV
jgi:hypothetical protein